MKSTSPESSPQGKDFNSRHVNKKIPLHADAGPELFEYAKSLRSDSTKAEKLLWEQLRAKRFMHLKFRRQHPIHAFSADFYCHELRLVIEVDGGYHYDTEQQKLDASRTGELERLGCTVIRFSNEEIENNIENVLKNLEKIVKSLKISSPKVEDLKDFPLSSRREPGRGDKLGRAEQ